MMGTTSAAAGPVGTAAGSAESALAVAPHVFGAQCRVDDHELRV
jgi:hypothetical protein